MSSMDEEELIKFLDEINDKFMKDLDTSEKIGRELAPKVIAIHKKKLGIATKEITDEEINEDDEKCLESFNRRSDLHLFSNIFKQVSLKWDDTIGTEKVKEILTKHGKFNLLKYVNCAKAVFLAYSGKIDGSTMIIANAMEYILTHSRTFGDSTHSIFQSNESDDESNNQLETGPENSSPLPNSKLFNKINQLIEDLTKSYDETKFQILNANTTYFALLMLRRIAKNETQFLNAFKKMSTHDTYVKLCPYPLDNQLPNCNLKIEKKFLLNSAHLAIEAYLNTTDRNTKRVLLATCITYLEWNGLQLPELFFKVKDLFKTTAQELFDALTSDEDYKSEIVESLFKLSDDYYKLFEKIKAGSSVRWFKYCRVLDGRYHLNLSAKENLKICAILAYLVDLSIGFEKSTIRNAHWVKPYMRDSCMESAKMLKKKIDKDPVYLEFSRFHKVYARFA